MFDGGMILEQCCFRLNDVLDVTLIEERCVQRSMSMLSLHGREEKRM
jgi:hypothetical protein